METVVTIACAGLFAVGSLVVFCAVVYALASFAISNTSPPPGDEF